MPTPSTPDNDDERLRAQLRALEEELAALKAHGDVESAGSRTGWWRPVVVVVMLVVACLLAPLSVVATWAHDQIGDTDRYVETITPLASDPAVKAAISDRISDEILARVDVEDVTAEVLTALAGQSFVPERAGDLLPSLAVPLSNAIETFIRDRVQLVVESDAFEQAWVEANRQAHTQMVAVLTGDTSAAVTVDEGAVNLNIASLVAAVKQRLLDEGFAFAARIPDVNATFTIFEAPNIDKAQNGFALLDTLARVLPILAVLLIVGAVLLARDRRRTLLASGLGVAGAMVLLGLTLNVVRPIYLDAVPTDVLPADAAAAIYDQLVRFIRTALRGVGVVFLAVALAAFWFAPTGAGAACRHGATGALNRLRDRTTGGYTGPVGDFLGTYRAFTRWTIVGLGALYYLALDHPTGRDAVVVISVIVVALVVLEFLAAPARRVVRHEE